MTAIPDDKTCTDKPQQWNKPSADTQDNGPILFSDIHFVHHSFGKRKADESLSRIERYKKYRACPQSLQEHIRQFCTSLDSQQNSSLFTAVMRSNDCQPLPHDHLNPQYTVPTTCSSTSTIIPCNSTSITICTGTSLANPPEPPAHPKEAVWKCISVTVEQARQIEIKMRGQSESSDWYEERRWRITASFFGCICRRLPTTSPTVLVNSIINQQFFKTVPPSCAWGRDNEDTAIKVYKVKLHEMGHTNVTVMKSGLVINPEYPWLGVGPDGLVTDPTSHDSNGLLEIKCPYKYRESTPIEAASAKGFCCRLEHGKLFLREQHQYYYQVQGQMANCSRKLCDFIIYTSTGISIERINFDEVFWSNMAPKLKTFYDTAVIPKLVERVQ